MKSWRDIGDGKVKCDNTGQVARLEDIRSTGDGSRVLRLSAEQWAKLEALAEWRTEQEGGREKFTPEKCIARFIDHALVGPSGWEHPSVATKGSKT